MIRFHLHAFGEFSPRHPLGRTVWPHHDLLFVHEGRLVVKPEVGEPIELVGGEGILIFPETPFTSGDVRARARASVQHFEVSEGARLPGKFDDLRRRSPGVWVRHGPPDPELGGDVERAIRMAAMEPGEEVQAMREGLLFLILGRFLAESSMGRTGSGALRPVLDWVRTQPPGDLTPRVVAARMGISESTLRRRFRAELGVSPGQFLLRMRMNEAKRLLRETLAPVKEVAMRCGYGSAIAFHHAFQESNGMTPRAYRMGNRVRG